MILVKILGALGILAVGTVVFMVGIWFINGTVIFDPELIEQGDKSKK